MEKYKISKNELKEAGARWKRYYPNEIFFDLMKKKEVKSDIMLMIIVGT